MWLPSHIRGIILNELLIEGPRGTVTSTPNDSLAEVPVTGPKVRVHLFSSDSTQWQLLRDRYLHRVEYLLEGSLLTLAAPPTPRSLPMRMSLKALKYFTKPSKTFFCCWNPPITMNGCGCLCSRSWRYILPTRALCQSSANSDSCWTVTSRPCGPILLLVQPGESPQQTTSPSAT